MGGAAGLPPLLFWVLALKLCPHARIMANPRTFLPLCIDRRLGLRCDLHRLRGRGNYNRDLNAGRLQLEIPNLSKLIMSFDQVVYNLRPSPHLWSRAAGRDQKNKIAVTIGSNTKG